MNYEAELCLRLVNKRKQDWRLFSAFNTSAPHSFFTKFSEPKHPGLSYRQATKEARVKVVC